MTTAPGPAASAPPLGVTLALVVAGGAVGVLARTLLLLPVADARLAAWVTATINVAGSLLLGIVVGWLDDRRPRTRTFLGTGVLGGFTTYSAFAVQSATSVATDPWATLALVITSVGLGLVGAFAGLFIGRRLADVPGEIEPPEEAE